MAVSEQKGGDPGKAGNLAQAVAEYLAHHGYRVARDVSMKGRSGANHTVDVLAEKADEVTTYRLLVHTRSWDQPVDRDVVAGVHLMASDLGMSKAVVLGARSGRRAWRPRPGASASSCGGRSRSRAGSAASSTRRPARRSPRSGASASTSASRPPPTW